MGHLERSELARLLRCPECGQDLERTRSDRGDVLCCAQRHQFPVVRGVPRFVATDQYSDSFSFQWNTHRTTQLDSFTGGHSSEQILIEKTGLSPVEVRGKTVLDVGVGAGRFTDVLSRWGAHVVGIDLSYAVDAAYQNFVNRPNVLIAQADLHHIPLARASCDFIISIGVLHHAPDTRHAFLGLVPFLKPGGSVAIWVYSREERYLTRARWIPFTSRIPDRWFYEWCRFVVPRLLLNRRHNFVQWLSRIFPFSDQGLGLQNDILDTFDGYSPRYHGVHDNEEVERWFHEAGLVNVKRLLAPTSVRGMRQPESTP